MLNRLRTVAGAEETTREMMQLMQAMFPLCRSISGNGVRKTFDLLQQFIPLQRTEVATGTAVFDWEVPKEWNIADAYVADSSGKRVIDFRANNLHVVSYSTPVRRTMTLDELKPHLFSLREQPDWIPYRTSYYREHWGFCLRHFDLANIGEGPFEVVIDATLAPGHLTYAECVVPGTTDEEVIIYTHSCHPSLANDNLTGMVIAAAIARDMLAARPRLTWRFIFGPGTIGSLAWLARNEAQLHRVRAGLTIGLLGDAAPLTYKRSRRGECVTDRVVAYVLRTAVPAARLVDFEPYGYDERQFCSPGFDLPIGRLSRSAHGEYPQYHTSADNLELIRPDCLAGSLRTLADIAVVLDENRRLQNLSPKGEPRLGKRGLYGSVGGMAPSESEHALLWLLSYSDGKHDLLAIAERSGLDFSLLANAATALEKAGLAATLDDDDVSTPTAKVPTS